MLKTLIRRFARQGNFLDGIVFKDDLTKLAERETLGTRFAVEGRPIGVVKTPGVHSSKLGNGIRVSTEEPRAPGLVTAAIGIEVGSRDEDAAESGATHLSSTVYYRSFFNTVETINFGMVQMSGGRYQCGFDRERIWYKFQCLPHDVVDVFRMMVDCALEPKTHVTVGNAQYKLEASHKFHQTACSHFLFTDLVMQSVFGGKGLGNPVLGKESNVTFLNAPTLQKFQIREYSTSKISLVGLGVAHHSEFAELSELYAKQYFPSENAKPRQQAQFHECDVRTHKNSKSSEIAVLFEAPSWTQPHVEHFHILRHLLGRGGLSQAADPLNLNQGHGLLNSEVYMKHAYFKSAEAFNMHFTDSGVFGLRAEVSPGKETKALEELAHALGKIDKKSFESAKLRLLLDLDEHLSCDFQRVEEYVKESLVFGKIVADEFRNKIQSATFEQFQKVLQGLAKAKFGFVAQGPKLGELPAFDKIKAQFTR